MTTQENEKFAIVKKILNQYLMEDDVFKNCIFRAEVSHDVGVSLDFISEKLSEEWYDAFSKDVRVYFSYMETKGEQILGCVVFKKAYDLDRIKENMYYASEEYSMGCDIRKINREISIIFHQTNISDNLEGTINSLVACLADLVIDI